MIETKRKEEISKSYLNALCAVKGISMQEQKHDDDGIDVILHKVILRADGSKYNSQISVQLKASATGYDEHDSYYSFPLKKKNYDDLRLPATTKPYLFLLILPEDECEWVTHSIEEIAIRRCMFWLDLKGLPDCENSSSVTVHLPKTNVVTSDELDSILKDIAEEVLQ